MCTDRLEVLAVKGVGWGSSRLWCRGGGYRAEKPPSMRRPHKTLWEGLQRRGGEGSCWRSPGLGLEGPRCPELMGPGSVGRCHPLTLSRARLAHDGVLGSDASCPGCFRSQRRSFWRKRSQSCLGRQQGLRCGSGDTTGKVLVSAGSRIAQSWRAAGCWGQ